MKLKLVCICFLLMSISSFVKSQNKIDPKTIENKMQWFADAKLGIFIHWGIYAVDGIDESWSFYNKKISYTDYMKQLDGFTAKNYNPDEWAKLIKESGARYAVITTKHHDGVALYQTSENHFSVVKNTPAKKDLIKPFYDALDKYGIKRGAYFSMIDWSHPDYPGFTKDSTRYKICNDKARWKRFRTFYQNQISEINTMYKPNLFWFDGDWEHSAKEWQAQKVRESILSSNSTAIINGRLQGYGDYDTPEQNIPVSRPKYNWWELCMTINDNWGYQQRDTNWKTPYEIITIFADVISNGGNLLLDIGPKADGTIPPEQIHVLKELGKWDTKHSEAVFNSIPGIPKGHFFGPTTLSKDSTTLYLFLASNVTGDVLIKGLNNQIKQIRVLGSDEKLTHKVVGKIVWSDVPGLVYINVPAKVQDQYMTVIAVDLDKKIDLYAGKGGFGN